MRTKLLPLSGVLLGLSSLASAASPTGTLDATIPVEVLAVDPALATGGIPLQPGGSRSPIALQPARVVRGAVRLNGGDVLMLALLGPVERAADGRARLDEPADRIAWCAPATLIYNFMTCYQDVDADGKFETSRMGLRGVDEPLALARVQAPKNIEPVAYRAATESELPRFQVGYRSCGATRGDFPTFGGPLRYETVVRRAEGMQPWGATGRCDSLARLLETRADGAKLYEIGRFKVEVRQKNEKELETALIDGLPPGTLLAHLRTSWPLTDATERPRDLAEISNESSFLVALGSPVIAAQAKPGDEIFSLEVRHALSGKLAVASEPRTKRDPLLLPAGTPVYGIAMRSSQAPGYDAEVIWCTPVQQPKGLTPYCFAPKLSFATLAKVYSDPFTVRELTPSGPIRKLPVVERGPADFGAPLVLTVRIDKAEKKVVGASWSLAPRGQKIYGYGHGLLRARDGSALMLIGGLLLKIEPADDGQSFAITTRGELADGAPLDLPMDAVRLAR